LLHPGSLTAEYSKGKRKAYLSPLKLLVTSIIFYALLTQGGLQISLFIGPIARSIAPTAVPEDKGVAETIRRIDRYGLLTRMLARQESTHSINSDEVRRKFHSQLERFAEPLSFTNVFLLALVLYGLFRRRRPLFVDHAAFAMHFVSFVMLSSLLM